MFLNRFLKEKSVFTISYKDLRSDAFVQAMGKIAGSPNFKNIKVAYNISRMAKRLQTEITASQKIWLELVTKYIEVNPKTLAPERDGNSFKWKEGVNAEEADKALTDYINTEIKVDRYKLKLQDLEPAGLSPNDLIALEPMLEETADLKSIQ